MVPGDIFQRLIQEDDWDGNLEDHNPLRPAQRGHLEDELRNRKKDSRRLFFWYYMIAGGATVDALAERHSYYTVCFLWLPWKLNILQIRNWKWQKHLLWLDNTRAPLQNIRSHSEIFTDQYKPCPIKEPSQGFYLWHPSVSSSVYNHILLSVPISIDDFRT